MLGDWDVQRVDPVGSTSQKLVTSLTQSRDGCTHPGKGTPVRLSKGSRFTTSGSRQNKSSHPMATPQNASTLAPGTALWMQFVVLYRAVYNTMKFQAQKEMACSVFYV